LNRLGKKGDMTMNRLSVITISTFLMALPVSAMHAANLTTDQAAAKRAQTTLQQINSQIESISETAFRMSTQSREPDDAEVQGVELNHLGEEINRVGRELKALNSERELLPAWQTEVIDAILPSMHEIAGESTDAITLFNKSQAQLFASNYPAETGEIATDAKKTATFLSDDLKLENARAKEARFADLAGRETPKTQGQ
jgi:uncharacterized protein YoxC